MIWRCLQVSTCILNATHTTLPTVMLRQCSFPQPCTFVQRSTTTSKKNIDVASLMTCYLIVNVAAVADGVLSLGGSSGLAGRALCGVSVHSHPVLLVQMLVRLAKVLDGDFVELCAGRASRRWDCSSALLCSLEHQPGVRTRCLRPRRRRLLQLYVGLYAYCMLQLSGCYRFRQKSRCLPGSRVPSNSHLRPPWWFLRQWLGKRMSPLIRSSASGALFTGERGG